MKLRIACLQLNPKLGEFEENANLAYSLLQETFKEKQVKKPNILILPELALTGYNFQSQQRIEPFLEETTKGASTQWAQKVSKTWDCFTLIGYPEKSLESPPRIYNSAVLVSPQGKVMNNYRKSFLYEADEHWGCSESSDGFQTVDLLIEGKTVKTSFGICMDLNPYKFEAPFTDFEFSGHCLKTGTRLILCPMAWLSPLSPSIKKDLSDIEKSRLQKFYLEKIDTPEFDVNYELKKDEVLPTRMNETLETIDFEPSKPDYSNINYWILRFFPFLTHVYKRDVLKENAVAVLCNRVGIESDVLYGGSTTILNFNGKLPSTQEELELYGQTNSLNPSVEVLGALGMGQQGILVRDIELT
ncbi:Amidase [Komagataella phaffii CBS 7435]|uniref:Amidase, removes the amide group from N-terminal asparagine and glutamine residues n=2 Tax=Komagataella phaffii TaxID=460519 RepID=C4QYD3_KOMPG|nr:uncharacterized protein PAS_chr1-4_0408 [Komagataella phaffii GS115]AOA60678.1 GQ67_01754T0 [Komagataella phaffii]CAH2447079.1 Amidase [Komagataella phaffii CBS 7435]AOA65456.1 GQ68_01769T0 [Komagataella phaffii GS115]CAY68256.1 Amidase, removes the amide group from N-terminal asparagine and glutamine residues [Komagataella phaffii GS115]CCA37326.1 Amidase [Komagataella phaffii CBS 7435]